MNKLIEIIDLYHKNIAKSTRAQERFQICKSCDRFDSTLARCKECGCFMKLKVIPASMHCPLEKW